MLASIVSRIARRIASAARLVTGFVGRDTHDRDLDDELAFHIEQATERNIRRGLTPDAARRAALLAFGGQTQWSEAARDEQRSRWFNDFLRDLRYGAASLGRNRAFAASAILTIALGLAATVTVFNFINSIYLRPLAVPAGARLVNVAPPFRMEAEQNLGFPAYRLLRNAAKSFDRVAAHYSTSPLYLTARGEAGEVEGAVVSAEYFPMLGIRPALGRFFLPAEDSVPDRDAVAVLAHRLWLSRFAGDSAVIGERVTINSRIFTIVGVAPDGFDGVVAGFVNQLWIPSMMMHTGYRWCDGFVASCAITATIARLAPGASLESARAELAALTPSIVATTEPSDSIRAVAAEPVVGIRRAEQARFVNLSKLLAAIAVILMGVACANLSSLLLARGLARQRELALRASLGAGRGRIARQLLTENLLVAAAGGTLGVLLSMVAARMLVGFFAADNEGYLHRYDVTLDWRVLTFAVAASVVAVLLFALIPTLRAARLDVGDILKSGDGTLRGGGARARMVLVTGQVVLSLALLIGAGLLTRSFDRLMSGGAFDPSRVAQIRLRPRLVGYGPDSGQAYVRRAIAAIRALPGVTAVSPVRGSLAIHYAGRATIALPGDAPVSGDRAPQVQYLDVGPDFFAALGVRVLAGREFTDRDDAASPLVAIVSESLARKMWPQGNVVGQGLMLRGKRFAVVGVVADYRPRAMSESTTPTAYISYWQSAFEPQVDARLAVRVEGDPASALPAIRRAAASADARVPITEVLSMTTQMAASHIEVRLGRAVLLVGATLALFLSAVGLYGVVAFLVAQRQREVGIRIAVGARPASVVLLFVRQGMRPIWIGGVIGLAASVAAAPLLSQWLFGIAPIDAVSVTIAVVSVGFVALLATYIPARRAARTDPAAVFRCD